MKKKISIKSYTFKAVIEPDNFPDGRTAFYAYIPELEAIGGASWGYTEEEAMKNLQEVAAMVIEELLKMRKYALIRRGKVSLEPLVTVTT